MSQPTNEPTPTPTPPAPPTPAPAPAPPAPEPKAFAPITSQADFDRIIGERLSKFNDYDSLKAKATKFDEAEEAAKSELEREKDRADKAEAKALTAERKAFAAEKGIPVELVTGATPQEWEASAAKALEWKGKPADQPTPPPVTPTAHAAGNNGAPAGSPGDIDAQIAEAEKSRNFTLAIALKQRKSAAQKTN